MNISEKITDLKVKIKAKQTAFDRLAAEIKKFEDQENTIRSKRDKANEILNKVSASESAKSTARKTYNDLTISIKKNETSKKSKLDARSKISSEISELEYSILVIEALDFVEEMKNLTNIRDTAKLKEAFKTKLQPQHNNYPHQQ
ncbi:putative nucleic acid-binding Zn-ribbon protein [Pseudomonas lurida]